MPDVMRVHADDPEYQAMVRAEIEWWATHRGVVDAEDSSQHKYVHRHYNRRYTGDPDLRWFETLHRYGEFKRGLVLGASGLIREARILETNPAVHLTFIDISPEVVDQRRADLGAKFPGRADAIVGDLNFLELEEDAYDFIMSSASIHHAINLEHVASQVARALTPDGFFFLEDYVGETRRLFTPAKKLAYELVYNRHMTDQDRTPTHLEWTNEHADASPFCGIRSGEVLDVMREYLVEQELHTAGALWLAMLYARDPRPMTWKKRPRVVRLMRRVAARATRPLRRRAAAASQADGEGFITTEYLARLLDVGERLADAGAIPPSNAFAIYRKRRDG